MIKKILLGLLSFVILIAIGGFLYYRLKIYQPPLISKKDRAATLLMPLPARLELHKGTLDLSKGIKINYPQQKTALIEKAVERFIKNTNLRTSNTGQKTGIVLKIICKTSHADSIPRFNEDESYALRIDKEIMLEANSSFGILYGLETLSQLIVSNGNPTVPKLEIEDSPRFPWRGIMLDVCRHWIPKEVVLRTIDAMAAVKMNVFHWHLSDDQGFRIECKVFPKLHEIGSNGKYYTQEEIKEVIRYAADRGIRIIPEFDMPGHSKSWQIAYPELSSVSDKQEFCNVDGALFAPPMDPTNEYVYDFLDKFIGEMALLFPDEYFHIGGDEVDSAYWNESEHIQLFMKENGLNGSHDLQAWFNRRISEIVATHDKKMAGWEEILHPDISDKIVIQSWRSQKSLFEGVQKGCNAILSAGYYLDHKLHAGKHYQVDPLVLPGAVDIVPDSANWKMYDLTMEIPSGEMKNQLVIFDKDPDNVFGFFAMMNDRTAFKNGKISDGILTFNMNSSVGNLQFTGQLHPDSVSGKLSLALLKFSCNGKQTGGSEKQGSRLPKIEVMKPLTEDEKSRILGGEAAMWSEVVGADNAESRIWPRTAAIAEKLWSPQELTTDEDDMYRRLEVVSGYLEKRGSQHNFQKNNILKNLIPAEGLPYLETLVDVLEEVKYYGRLADLMNRKDLYLPDLPLNGVVDAARPESLEARKFNLLAKRFAADKNNEELKVQILNQLEIWSKNHEKLNPFLNTEELAKVENLSSKFSIVAKEIYTFLMNEQEISLEEKESLNEKLNFLENGENGMLLAVVPGLKKLLEV